MKGSKLKLVSDNSFNDEIDGLFQLPLAEFTGARNALAARLKKSGRSDEAVLVKALAKPPISAWAVNQLFWNHRDTFDQLLESGERFHKAQGSRLAGKVADMRSALDERRDALNHLSELSASLLSDAGHNPAPDTLRRITTTLEAISVYASRSDGPRPGRLTHDVDPPGFESVAGLVLGTGPLPKREPARSSPKLVSVSAKKGDDARRVEAARNAKIGDAKVSLQSAKKALTEARAKANRLEATMRKASAEAKEADKQRRDAEARFRKAKATADEATERSRSVADELEEATTALKAAQREVEKVSKELESLIRA